MLELIGGLSLSLVLLCAVIGGAIAVANGITHLWERLSKTRGQFAAQTASTEIETPAGRASHAYNHTPRPSVTTQKSTQSHEGGEYFPIEFRNENVSYVVTPWLGGLVVIMGVVQLISGVGSISIGVILILAGLTGIFRAIQQANRLVATLESNRLTYYPKNNQPEVVPLSRVQDVTMPDMSGVQVNPVIRIYVEGRSPIEIEAVQLSGAQRKRIVTEVRKLVNSA